MNQNVTFIDDLLDLDDPTQRGAFNKVVNKTSIKTLPPMGDETFSKPYGQVIEPFNDPHKFNGPQMPWSSNAWSSNAWSSNAWSTNAWSSNVWS